VGRSAIHFSRITQGAAAIAIVVGIILTVFSQEPFDQVFVRA